MARIAYLDKDDLAEADRELLARDINLYKALVHSPGALRHFSRLGQFIRHESGLDPRLRELAILQVGYMTRSEYEYSHHIEIGRTFGVSDDDIRAIATETAGQSSGLDPLARTVLLAAREITDGPGMSAATFARLQDDLNDEHLVDLVLTISFYNGVVRLLATLAIDVEDGYADHLTAFPLPAAGA